MTEEFVEALIEAPMGVAVLARIEEKAWPRSRRRDTESDAEAVDLAVDWVEGASFGAFLALAVWAGYYDVTPWNPYAPEDLAAYYRLAETRRPVAAAIAQRFGDVLHAPMDAEDQEWWTTDNWPRISGRPMIGGRLWTMSQHPPEVHDEILCAWEFHPPPTSRWQVEIEGRPRVKEIHRPADWIDLVERWPDSDAPMYRQYGTWAFESPRPPTPRPLLTRLLPTKRRRRRRRHDPYDPDAHIRELLAVPGQHAVHPAPPRLAGVDWDAAAGNYDAVHVSWAGFLTAEGFVSELADGSVTMLRGFASETTLWLSDVFAPVCASPLDAPEGLTEENCYRDCGIDADADPWRAARDRINLEVLLGRQEAPAIDPGPDTMQEERIRRR